MGNVGRKDFKLKKSRNIGSARQAKKALSRGNAAALRTPKPKRKRG